MYAQDFSYSDGVDNFLGYLAYDDTTSAARPGVLIAHDAMGLGQQPMENARRLAALGYVALCFDLYGGRATANTQADIGRLMGPLMGAPGALARRTNAGLSALTALPQVDAARVAAIGYCLGGRTVLEMARHGAPLAGVVSIHGTLKTGAPAAPGAVKAKILVLTGAEDPFAPSEDIAEFEAEMTAAGADWQVIRYGGAQHAFAIPEAGKLGMGGLKYDPLIDRRAWNAMCGFFDEIFA